MKKFIAGLMVGVILLSGVVYAAGTRIEVSLETLTFFIDGEEKEHETLIHEGRTYAPLGFIAESVGKEILWDGETRSIHIGPHQESSSYEDGRYRGIYEDRGVQQVSIQFHLEDGIFRDLSYRHLYHGGNDYRQIEEGHELYPVVEQHQQILDYLEDKPLEAIFDLYTPEIMIDDIDTFTGATVRANKVLSAIRDGLNRGLYTPADEFSRELGEYENGRYRGIFADRGVQQVSIQFHLEDGIFRDLSYRHLYHGGNDYRQIEEGHELYPVVEQHQQILDYLEDKPLEAIFDLYTPEIMIDDIDTFTGATVRANKVFSAIQDGLNRGLY